MEHNELRSGKKRFSSAVSGNLLVAASLVGMGLGVLPEAPAIAIGFLGILVSAASCWRLSTAIRSRDRRLDTVEQATEMYTELRSEIGELVDENDEQAQDLIASIRGALNINQKIQQGIDEIDDQADTMGEQVRATSAAVEEISATMETFNKRLDSQSAAVVQTSSAVEQMNANLESVSRITNERRGGMEELVDLTAKGETQAEQTTELIDDINNHVDAVQSVIEVINNVASQTNLLSMNAAIEAAHAGDAGRGFAVVAEEIRKLAESTSQNANTIGGTLKKIVQEIGQAQELGGKNLQFFRHVRTDAQEIARAFGEIDSATGEISVGSQEVVKSTNELVQITEEIQQGGKEIDHSVREMHRGLREILEASEQTDKNSERIDAVLTQNNRVLAKLAGASLKGVESVQDLEVALVGSGNISMNSNMVALNHLHWVIRVRQLIDGQSYRRSWRSPGLEPCWLTRWLNSSEGQAYKDSPEFTELLPVHREFHTALEALVQKVQSVPVQSRTDELEDELEQDYRQLLEIVSRFTKAIDQLGSQVDKQVEQQQASELEAQDELLETEAAS
ncbi:methyl-accepting chemotaxis protein [Spirochaeta africana]|uniref:Methyl-accepting chemotaxis protein n=1 Tax=Spirochaeta africana (strain ATCC 700263 / DSM 8902 / Z-7692) TaxID=889378 RepID=H9UHY8_SPIAZ|nr:methyl-accepting chemotaxis protein [Spirochaeta africana]AFG37131.1 methyl-accepting chemotaxis protein [Spirochaeta africana DSM 8902]